MNRRKIYGIVVLMSIALTGLVSFQGYWINQTVQANQERFEQNVYAALNSVVNQIERQEAYVLAYQTLEQRVLQLDTSGLYPIASSSSSQVQIIQRGEEGQSSVYTYNQQSGQHSESPKPEIDLSVGVAPADSPAILTIRPPAPAPNSNPTYVYWERIRKLERRTGMFEDAIQQLITGSRPVHSRVSNQQIDSLLRVALGDRGIQTPYEYAVVDAEVDSILMTNTPQLANVLHADAQVALFPNDFVPSSAFLNIKFPEQHWYLLKKIWTTLISSLLFTGIVVYCFVYAINTIFRQKKLSDMKNDFINNMTHELKTPISTVSLAVEALQDAEMAQNPTILERYLNIIREENARLGSQVERVLQIASLDKKDFTLKKEEVEVHELIEKIIKNATPSISKREGSLDAHLNAERTTVCADPHHLSNVLTNLIDNANKYSPEAPHITLRTKNTRTGMIIEVEDQGMGMSREVQTKVFDKFYRAPTGNRHDVKGFGLGLSYVRSIVEAHGGQVSVQSKLGEGSTFTVYLPYEHEGITR
uniref:histidine kinase n=1 Tax=Roseihalotalea indica TaxID=2867963 RepID=A0AA49JJ84_9BACT|nr:HAMP domain-containing sensor histidine kinase [Tunicatimonas sp. TK19036]